MTSSRWNDALAVGVPTIDSQHKHLFILIDTLRSVDSDDSEEIKKAIDELNTYAAMHFALEERLMDRFNYPYADNHLRAHATFISQVGEYDVECAFGSGPSRSEVVDYIEGWISNHIMTVDMQFGEYLQHLDVIETIQNEY
ncbi:bacteriohemerythrin [Desulfovibrio inopinatus]|uniref:bacteriohemerythrin n=1 Tax=Desulfovibrio inopinatus TaxID=102109 RepID=UPI0004199EBC|nr:bacteriohemerythrin [Desulfovibrio inopinatus]